MTAPGRRQAPRRIVIQYPAPAVDGGRYPAKRCVGDRVARRGRRLPRRPRPDPRRRALPRPGDERWQEVELRRIDAHLGGVRWAAQFPSIAPGRWQYTIEAWTDVFGTWRDELARKVAAGQHDLAGELSEGVVLLRAAAEQTRSRDDRAS